MAEFSGKIHSVTFMDYPKNSMVEVLWSLTGSENEGLTPWHMEVDFTQQNFRDLLQEVSLDKIEEQTIANAAAARSVYDAMIDQKVSDKWKEEEVKIKAAYDNADLYTKERYEEVNLYTKEAYDTTDLYTKERHEEVDAFTERATEEAQAQRKELQGQYQHGSKVVKLDDITGKDLLAVMVNRGEDKDFIFAAKIAILEDPKIAKSSNAAMSSNGFDTKVPFAYVILTFFLINF